MTGVSGSTMTHEANGWLEIVASLPDGATRFQRELMVAELADTIDPARAIMLAYAALTVMNAGQAGAFEPWYREKSMSLLRKASEIMAAMDASEGRAVN